MKVSIAVIICAAGSSKRMGGIKKEYLPLYSPPDCEKSLTVLGAAAKAFASCPQINTIVIVVPPGSEKEINDARACLPPEMRSGTFGGNKGRVLFVHGGPTRRASVLNALLALEPYNPSIALIHDGARPWVSPDLITRIIDAVVIHGAAIPALPLIETPKEAESSVEYPGTRFITRHLKRACVYTAQTPQGFRYPDILRAHEKAAAREKTDTVEYTDDAEIWGEFTGRVALVNGDPANRKITYPGDLPSKDTP